MISFSKLGNYGRLGNQLFQYAFLRSQAQRLGTQFYCPKWIGDTTFDLQDIKERTGFSEVDFLYQEVGSGFHADAFDIQDKTEIVGFFQSDKFFAKNDVLSWFTFNETICADMKKKYAAINFSESTAIHIRLGDYATPQLTFYTPRPFYFRQALAMLEHTESILVFSDDPQAARKYLKNIPGNFIFIEGNTDYEDLYVMSICRNVICSPSSFSWWGAYLNLHEDKRVIIPEYWYVPGGKVVNSDLFVDSWIRLRAHRTFFDTYYMRFIPFKIEVYYRRIQKAVRIIKHGGVSVLIKELKNFLTL